MKITVHIHPEASPEYTIEVDLHDVIETMIRRHCGLRAWSKIGMIYKGERIDGSQTFMMCHIEDYSRIDVKKEELLFSSRMVGREEIGANRIWS